MQKNYSLALSYVLAHEGGKVDNPKDPGGRTNQGVTQAVYDAYRRGKGLETRDVYAMEDYERDEMYKVEYWDKIRGDELPSGLDYAVFDYAVNSGVGRAVKDLQRTYRLNQVDGSLGSGTLAAVGKVVNSEQILAYVNRRVSFLKSLKTFTTFGKGWMRRVEGDFDGYQQSDHGVVDYAINMASLQPEILPLPSAIGSKDGEIAAKANESQAAVLKSPAGAGALATGAGVAGTTINTFAQQIQPHIGETFLGKVALGAFILLSLLGAVLVAYSYWKKFKEAGGSLKELLA